LPKSTDPNLLVGIETSDDAGVYRLSPTMALVQTLDFFTPIVDDPYDYGTIAAANSLSDVYAMGGRPITALNICCFNPDSAEPGVWAKIIEGMRDKTLESGAVIAGGHTVENDHPLFGLSVTGLINPETIFRNDAAQDGDEIWLSKPLGTGIVTTAAKFDKCTGEELAEASKSMAKLNAGAATAAHEAKVRCATDVTGFGLTGHGFEMAKGAGVTLFFRMEAIPIMPGALEMYKRGMSTGVNKANRELVEGQYRFEVELPKWHQEIVFDPQTAGGLLVALPADKAQALLNDLHEAGVTHAMDIGEVKAKEADALVFC